MKLPLLIVAGALLLGGCAEAQAPPPVAPPSVPAPAAQPVAVPPPSVTATTTTRSATRSATPRPQADEGDDETTTRRPKRTRTPGVTATPTGEYRSSGEAQYDWGCAQGYITEGC